MRYYWLRLKKDFFQQHQIKVLKALPNGRLYALIYLELLAESTSHEGMLRYSEMLPYDIVTLASVLDEDKDNVEKAIETLARLELLEILDDGTIYMRAIEKLIGSETKSAERKRIYREKQKTLSLECPTEIKEQSKEKRFIKPSLEDVKQYCAERQNNVDPEQWIDYYESNGWKVGKNPMKDWKACVRTWEKNRATSKAQKREDVVPDYDETNNPTFDAERYNEIMKRREMK